MHLLRMASRRRSTEFGCHPHDRGRNRWAPSVIDES